MLQHEDRIVESKEIKQFFCYSDISKERDGKFIRKNKSSGNVQIRFLLLQGSNLSNWLCYSRKPLQI